MMFTLDTIAKCDPSNKMHCQLIAKKNKILAGSTIESRLTIVSREAKKNQRPLSELFTWNTAKKLANALAKPP